MQLIKTINKIFISILFVTAISHASNENNQENTIIEKQCQTLFYNLKNTRSYKILNRFPEYTISNFPEFTEEIKNRIISTVPTFTTIALYYLLCMYLGVLPYDNLFYFAAKLLLLDCFFTATNTLIKPNTILVLISVFYYVYDDIISPVSMMSTMMSSFDIGMDLSSLFIVSSLLTSGIYTIHIKTNCRYNLVNKIVKENERRKKDSLEGNNYNYAQKEKTFCDIINNNSNIYLYDDNITANDEFFIKICTWFNDSKRLSLCNQQKELKNNLDSYLTDFDSLNIKDKCMSFLKESGVVLLSDDCKQLSDIIFIPNDHHKLLFELKNKPNKITSSNLISLLQPQYALTVEINNIENSTISDKYNSFTVIRNNTNYYLLINADVFNENYMLKVMLFFAGFNKSKINKFNSTNDNSIIIKYNNRHQIREALKIIIKIFNCNITNTALYKISELSS